MIKLIYQTLTVAKSISFGFQTSVRRVIFQNRNNAKNIRISRSVITGQALSIGGKDQLTCSDEVGSIERSIKHTEPIYYDVERTPD